MEQGAENDDSISTASACANLNDGSGGAICELCLKRRWFSWPGVRYRCYRDSLAGSLAVAAMLFVHRLLRTWINPVSRFIVLTTFCRDKFIECGIPSEKIALKPNFLSQDPGEGQPSRDPHFLFLGRLSEEKGVRTLVKAWDVFSKKWDVESGMFSPSSTGNQQPSTEIPPQLLIAGTGPLEAELSGSSCERVQMLGHIDRSTSVRLLKSVRALVFPSGCYETFGLAVVEAMACGTPVLVGDGGAAASLIRNGETGLYFRSGDSVDLAEKMEWMLAHPAESAVMGKAARQEYELLYTAEANYKMLMDIYGNVIAEAGRL